MVDRYDVDAVGYGDCDVEEVEREDGEWVKYKDYERDNCKPKPYTVTDSGSDGIVDYLSPHRHKSCKPASHKLNKCKCRRSKVNIRTWMFWHDHETVLIEYAICCETCKRQSHPAYDISLAIQDWNEMNKKREE